MAACFRTIQEDVNMELKVQQAAAQESMAALRAEWSAWMADPPWPQPPQRNRSPDPAPAREEPAWVGQLRNEWDQWQQANRPAAPPPGIPGEVASRAWGPRSCYARWTFMHTYDTTVHMHILMHLRTCTTVLIWHPSARGAQE